MPIQWLVEFLLYQNGTANRMANTILPHNGLVKGYNQAKGALSPFKPLDPEKAEDFAKTKAVLQQTLHAMKNSRNDIAQQKKAMAQQKVARIKEALKSLKQMAFADPKAMARMASRLARELASAIKEYASAGATSTEISTASASTDGAVPNEATNATEGTENQTEPYADTNMEMTMTEADIEAETAGTADTKDEKFQLYEKTQNFGTDQDDSKTTRKKDDDSPFIKDAKEVMDELRNLIKMLRAKAGKKPFMQKDDVSDAEKALKEVKSAFASLTRGVTSA